MCRKRRMERYADKAKRIEEEKKLLGNFACGMVSYLMRRLQSMQGYSRRDPETYDKESKSFIGVCILM